MSEYAAVGVVFMAATAAGVGLAQIRNKSKLNSIESPLVDAVGPVVENGSTIDALIGNTQLLKLEKLSRVTGCDIYVKVCSVFFSMGYVGLTSCDG